MFLSVWGGGGPFLLFATVVALVLIKTINHNLNNYIIVLTKYCVQCPSAKMNTIEGHY